MSEILPNIHRIETPLGERLLAQHILIGDRVYLVDTGLADTPEEWIFPYLDEMDVAPEDVAGAIITHPDSDHFGGNAAVAERYPRALIVSHTLDAPLVESPERCLDERYDFDRIYGAPMPGSIRSRARTGMGSSVPVDVRLAGDEELRIAPGRTIRVLHCPGHSLGHLVLYDSENRAAVLTDAALGSYIPTTAGEAMFAPTYRFRRPYLATIRKLRELQLETLLCSHFPVIRGREAVEAFLDESEEFVVRLDRLVIGALQEAGRPTPLAGIVAEIRDRVQQWTSPGDPMVSYSLCYPVAGALDDGVSGERLEVSSDGYRLR
jgi:glyoxylase-like metal-dependent hydrolase (beta-lactamase superfamily II)